MKRSRLSMRDFIFETLFWIVIAFAWYNNLFLTNLNDKIVIEFNAILIVMIVLLFIINMITTMSWKRSSISAVYAILIPLGVYTFIVNKRYMSRVFRIIVLVAIAVETLCVGYIMIVNVRAKIKRRWVYAKARMRYLSIGCVVTAVSVCLMMYLLCRMFVVDVISSPSEKSTFTYGDEYTIAANMDSVLLLQKEEWVKLNLEKRLDVLQCICNIEGNYLGLNRKIHICASDLDECIMGYYNHSSFTIQLSADLLEEDDPYKALETVCHEMFHAAQCRYVEIYEELDDEAKNSYFLYNASVYADEFENYKSGDKVEDISDYYEYYKQWCEQDARSYATEATEDYFQRISEYLDQSDV